jgi:hypothetical protein
LYDIDYYCSDNIPKCNYIFSGESLSGFQASGIDGNAMTSALWEFSSGGNRILNVTPINVSPTPIPSALPLFATGLGVIGLLRRYRKTASRNARLTSRRHETYGTTLSPS